jgi:hypothetical protein
MQPKLRLVQTQMVGTFENAINALTTESYNP